MNLFKCKYNECPAFIDVDEVVQLYVNNKKTGEVIILYKNGITRYLYLTSEEVERFSENLINYKISTTKQYV